MLHAIGLIVLTLVVLNAWGKAEDQYHENWDRLLHPEDYDD